MFKRMNLVLKLVVAFLAVGMLPLIIVGSIAYFKAATSLDTVSTKGSTALEDASFNQLKGIREIKKKQIESFFSERKGDMGVLVETVATLRIEAFAKLRAIQAIKKAQVNDYIGSLKSQLKMVKNDPYVIGALSEFNASFELNNNSIVSDDWNSLVKQHDPRLKGIMTEYGWYDIFLISKDGTIIYTGCRESDLGMSIPGSELKASSIGKAFEIAQQINRDALAVADFAPYSPSKGAPAGFMMAKAMNKNQLIGYVALQFPLDKVNEIMLRRDGMGKTGESYLVGPDNLMRSDSFLDPKGHSVLASFKENNKVDTEGTRNGLDGKEGQDVIMDYNNNPVLSCWDPVDIGSGVRWVMLSEMDVAEAFCPVDDKGESFFKKYKEMYGYYDLFLINPDGYCFYTVCQEADYKTNLVDGKYKDSGLGELTRKVIRSGKYGMADFRPYAPSNGEPAAFIAQPIVHDGETELVVGLQLSLGAINGIMQQRDGMGKSGEAYLVGQDFHMRSDSFLDPENFSVKASFVKNNLAKSDMIVKALKGETGVIIGSDYTKAITGKDNMVLSAYTPVRVSDDVTWAMIGEINEDEALAAKIEMDSTSKATSRMLLLLTSGIGIAAAVIVFLVSIGIGRSISKPIMKVVDVLRSGAEQVASASNQVSQSSQSMAQGASEQASSLEETSASLEEMSATTAQNSDNSLQVNQMAKAANHGANQGQEAMSRMADAMAKIQKSSDETAKIVKAIEEIAFQTNLLALNAAVEAARAGDAGKGFAVVAEEVRNLAQRSAEAAKNTSELIDGSVKNAREGATVADDVAKALGAIGENVGKVSMLAEEVSSASGEQTRGIEQVNNAVAQLNQVTQESAANAEESASASEELSAQAREMEAAVQRLTAIVQGAAAAADAMDFGSSNGGYQESAPQQFEKARHSMPSNGKSHALSSGRPLANGKAKNAEAVIPLSDDDLGDF